MKRFFLLFLVLILALPLCFAEEERQDDAGNMRDLFGLEADPDSTLEDTGTTQISVDNLFLLTLPEGWLGYKLTEAQEAAGLTACFGDGTHFMFVKRQEDDGTYADLNEYCMSLTIDEKKYGGIMVATFGGQDFACYSDYVNVSSDCTAIFPGQALYTFYFYPADGDPENAMQVFGIMNSFTRQ